MKFAIPGNNYAQKSWWVYGSIIKEAQMIIEDVLYCTTIAKLIMTPFHSKVTSSKTCSKNFKTYPIWPFWKHVKNSLIEFCELFVWIKRICAAQPSWRRLLSAYFCLWLPFQHGICLARVFGEQYALLSAKREHWYGQLQPCRPTNLGYYANIEVTDQIVSAVFHFPYDGFLSAIQYLVITSWLFGGPSPVLIF